MSSASGVARRQVAGTSDGAKRMSPHMLQAVPGGSPACDFLLWLLSTGWKETEVRPWESMGRGNSSVFLRDRRKHLWGRIEKGQGHCQTVLVGSRSQHAQLGRVGTKLRVPGQNEDLGSTQEPLLGKSPGN